MPAAMTNEQSPPLFAVRTEHHRYAVRHPDSGLIVDRETVDHSGWLEAVLLPEAEAKSLAEDLSVSTRAHWWTVPEPQPCPNCGRGILVDDLDWAYPENRARSRWTAGCFEHNFGCGYEVFGSSYEEVMQKWNTGAPHEGPKDEFFEAERFAVLKVTPPAGAVLQLPVTFTVGERRIVVEAKPDAEPGTVTAYARHTSQPALVRQALRALRAHCGEEAKLETLNYGGPVDSG